MFSIILVIFSVFSSVVTTDDYITDYKDSVSLIGKDHLQNDSLNKAELLSDLIFKIENNDYSYLSDTLYGECLVYAFGKYDETLIEAEGYILKRDVEENPKLLENYEGTNLKEGLLIELYSLFRNQKSLLDTTITVIMVNSEFDSSCIFEFIIVDNHYKLMRIYGVG